MVNIQHSHARTPSSSALANGLDGRVERAVEAVVDRQDEARCELGARHVGRNAPEHLGGRLDNVALGVAFLVAGPQHFKRIRRQGGLVTSHREHTSLWDGVRGQPNGFRALGQ